MKEYVAPQMMKVEINSSEAFAQYTTCTVDYGNTQGYSGCCETGAGPLLGQPSQIGCSINLITP